MGYMRGRGRRVFGYSNVDEDYLSRVNNTVSPDGMIIENYGLADNLMCLGIIRDAGGEIITYPAPHSERFTDLTAFEKCLRHVAEIYSVR